MSLQPLGTNGTNGATPIGKEHKENRGKSRPRLFRNPSSATTHTYAYVHAQHPITKRPSRYSDGLALKGRVSHYLVCSECRGGKWMAPPNQKPKHESTQRENFQVTLARSPAHLQGNTSKNRRPPFPFVVVPLAHHLLIKVSCECKPRLESDIIANAPPRSGHGVRAQQKEADADENP
jgi:hypothetical protein